MIRASAWQRLAPRPVSGLAAIEEHLTGAETARRLRAADARREYPQDVLTELRTRGVVDVFHPDTATAVHVNALNALTARHSGGLAITLGVNGLALLPLYLAGTAEQLALAGDRLRHGAFAAMLLTELPHGSNLARTEARAQPVPDGYRLHGEKQMINGGTRHQLLMTLLRVPAPSTEPGGADRADGYGLFLVERDDTVEPLPAWTTLPARAADISGVRFVGTHAGPGSLIGGPAEGLNLVQLTLALSRGGIGSLASGVTSGALDRAVDHARERDIYGEPIVRLGAIAEHLMRMSALDTVVAAMAVKATHLVNTLGPAAGHFTAVAKYACCALAERAVTEGRRVLGARALVEEYGYAEKVRDVLLYGVFDGTSHILLDQLQWRLERFATGRSAAGEVNDPLATAYAATPELLTRTARRRLRPYAPDPASRCAALATAGGGATVGLLGRLFTGLYDVVRLSRAGQHWSTDQAWRFDAARLLAEAEALLAACELVEPGCRTALGLTGPADAVDEAALGYAVGWLGAELAARVRLLAAELGGPATAADGLVEEFGGHLPHSRTGLRDWLLRAAPPRPSPDTSPVAAGRGATR